MEKLQEVGRNTTGMKKRISTWAKGVGLRGNMNKEKGYAINFGSRRTKYFTIVRKRILGLVELCNLVEKCCKIPKI